MFIFFLFLAFDELVCVVGREPITKQELNYVSIFYPGMSYEDLTDRLIKNEIILHLAEKETLNVSSEEINKTKQQLMLNSPALSSLLENDYINELYVEQIKAQIYSQRLLGTKFKERLNVSPTDVRKFYQSHKDSLKTPETITINRIKIPVFSSESNWLLEKTKDILAMYREGEDFSSLVKKYSDDVSTVPYNGKLGSFTPSDIPPHLTGVLKLEEGEAEIFESPTGYHIIKLEERKGIHLVLYQILLEAEFREEELKSAEKRALTIKEKWSDNDSMYSEQVETIGPLPLQVLSPALRSIIDTMELNQISEPILEGMSFLLFKVRDKQKSKIPEFSEIKEKLNSMLMQEKMSTMLNEWIEKERKHIFIKRM